MLGFGKKSAPRHEYTAEYVVRDMDNIMSLAQYYGVPWAELAEVNALKPPYVLMPGTTIRVPAEPAENGIGEDGDIYNTPSSAPRTIGAPQHYMATPSSRNATPSLAQPSDRYITRRKSSLQPVRRDATHTGAPGKEPRAAVPDPAADSATITQPIAEPTTRAIDIEWMRDDEEAYAEEMHKQQKSVNRWFIAVGIGAVVVLIGAIWFATTTVVPEILSERVSVDVLIRRNAPSEPPHSQSTDVATPASEQPDIAQPDIAQPDIAQLPVAQDDAATNDATGQKTAADPTVKPADVTVQVLNAGGPTGAAGTATKTLSSAGYAAHAARNAKNPYTGTIIYYAAGKKDAADAVAAALSSAHGAPKFEESSDVTKTYAAMVVVVIGAQ